MAIGPIVRSDKAVRFYVALAVVVNVDDFNERVTALEAGPFSRLTEARDFVRESRGQAAGQVHVDCGVPSDLNLVLQHIQLPIIGATIDWYSDARGTFNTLDVY